MNDRIGQQIGNYRLSRLLGQGGFAEVYLGEHIYLKTQAALKFLQGKLSPQEVQDFMQEAQTIAALKHPHIVRVYDFGLEHMMPYIVMDYAPHGTVRDRHHRGKIVPLTQILSYTQQVGAALAYTHEHKLIHRDVKPENMLLNEQNQVQLSDFGIATIAHRTSSMKIQNITGTVSYMAPEQFRGYPTPASDQYSLGIILYEWLCGECPFRATDFIEMGMKHATEPVPSLRKKIPTLSPEVEEIVFKALAKNEKQRFPHIQDFVQALEHAITSPSPTRTTLPPIKIPGQPWHSGSSDNTLIRDVTSPEQSFPKQDFSFSSGTQEPLSLSTSDSTIVPQVQRKSTQFPTTSGHKTKSAQPRQPQRDQDIFVSSDSLEVRSPNRRTKDTIAWKPGDKGIKRPGVIVVTLGLCILIIIGGISAIQMQLHAASITANSATASTVSSDMQSTATQHMSLTATANATFRVPPNWKMSMYDPLSTIDNKWSSSTSGTSSCAFNNGAYHAINSSDSASSVLTLCETNNIDVGNFFMEVSINSRDTGCIAGVAFHITHNNGLNGYLASLSSDGSCATSTFSKYYHDVELPQNPLINDTKTTYFSNTDSGVVTLLEISCVNGNISVYNNRTLSYQIADRDYNHGSFALISKEPTPILGSGSSDISYSNFQLWTPAS